MALEFSDVVSIVKMSSICWIMDSRVRGWESSYVLGCAGGTEKRLMLAALVGVVGSGSSGDRGRLREGGDWMVIPSLCGGFE